MWVVMRERERVENVFFSFFSLLQYVFFKREIKKRCVCRSGDGKELEQCLEFFSGHDRVRIYIHNLQCQCNLSLNCNEQYKEEIDHDSSKL